MNKRRKKTREGKMKKDNWMTKMMMEKMKTNRNMKMLNNKEKGVDKKKKKNNKNDITKKKNMAEDEI